MRKIPIALILAAVFTAAVTVYITVRVLWITSFNPAYVTWNGTNYIITTSGASPWYTFGPMRIVTTNVTTLNTITGVGYASGDAWYSSGDVGIAIVNFPSMPNATAIQTRSGVYVYKWNSKNFVLVYGKSTTSGGTSGYIIFVYKPVATYGSLWLFIPATQADISGIVSSICSMSPFVTAGTAIVQAQDNNYACPIASWGSGGLSSMIKTGQVTISAGTVLGSVSYYSYSWGAIEQFPVYWTAGSANIVGAPLG